MKTFEKQVIKLLRNYNAYDKQHLMTHIDKHNTYFIA